jgi:ubiquinone biosynthesis protein COQ9
MSKKLLSNMNVEAKYFAQKHQLTEAIFKLLPFSEWRDSLIEDAETACNFPKEYHYIIFPDGLREIVEYFEEYQDELMLKRLSKIESPTKIREKVALALKCRIKNIPKIIHTENRNYFTQPDNILIGAKVASKTCDKIWRYAGDNSTDFNYYTKRGLLLSVYLPSILFYIMDNSEDSTNTEKFIDQSIANIIKVSSVKNLIKLPKIEDIPILRLFS